MIPTPSKIRDPVCGRWVDPDQHALVYLQIHFAFCSRQCRERFEANPGLYSGRPGQAAPKQEGREAIKHRHLQLDEPVPEACIEPLREALLAMMGVTEVQISGNRIVINYDLLQASAEQIEAVIRACDLPLDQGWREHLRRAWVHFAEENEISSLAGTPGRPGGGCH